MASTNDAITAEVDVEPNHPAVTAGTSSGDQEQEPRLTKDSEAVSVLDTVTVEMDDNEKEKKNNRKSILDSLQLPPPPAYDLSIQGLSIGVPRPERYLPLPVPIPYPAFLSKEKDLSYLEQTIIHDVDARCGSGEVLAM
jgi:hypothetical protein